MEEGDLNQHGKKLVKDTDERDGATLSVLTDTKMKAAETRRPSPAGKCDIKSSDVVLPAFVKNEFGA
jgi:hypothetical protein